MSIQVIGFPDAIAQDLATLLKAEAIQADQWSSASLCELCIVDESADSQAFLDRLATVNQPTIVVGEAVSASVTTAHMEFCTKPFRLEALRSMAERIIASHQAIAFGPHWQFYPDYRYLSHADKPRIELTDKETELLQMLYQQCPEAVDKEQLLKHVWGYDAGMDTRTLETHIYRLRTKLEPLSHDGMELATAENGYVWQQK